MNSKEALEKLRQNNKDNSHLFDDELLDIIEKDLDVLEILKRNPFILEVLFKKGFGKEYDERYMWGTITDEEVNKIKEWLNK